VNIVGLIPARGGSKGLPGKNLISLGGRPLIAYTCDAALGSRLMSRVIVSTDDPAIAATVRAHGIEAPFLRPAELSSDEALMRDVACHALAWLQSTGEAVDVLVILQPTSPLRRAEHIDAAIELLARSGADAVVSVVKVPHRFGPASLMSLHEGRLTSIQTAGPLRRQDKPVLYARNGPAVLALTRKALEGESFYSGNVGALEMSEAESIDIDSAEDLLLAECLLRLAGRAG
jgi:CMP-N,N'-diacetyllegionaminic acid synthase